MIPVSLHPTAVLGLRGKPGWAGHGLLTPSQLYQGLAVEPGQAVVEHKVPFAAPPQGATLWPQPRLLRAGWLGVGEGKVAPWAPSCLWEIERSSGIGF